MEHLYLPDIIRQYGYATQAISNTLDILPWESLKFTATCGKCAIAYRGNQGL
jgi:hypothetical protein